MPMPDIDKIIAFEAGEMTDDQVAEFMQAGIDSGWVWQLQGCYGRTAQALIDSGVCSAMERGVGQVSQRC